jgi:tetratricopeptide (TPR) repeat protein
MTAAYFRAYARFARCLLVATFLFLGCTMAFGQTAAAPLAQAYDALHTSNYGVAIAQFRQAIADAPTKITLHKDLAYTYLKVGENAGALDQFREAMRLDANDTSVALEYAFLCNESTAPGPCPTEARRVFDRIRKSTGHAADAATAERAFQNVDGPLVAGIERWKKAIEMGANDFSAHYELASLAERRDELALAAEHYQKAWQTLPDRRSALVDLGRVWKALDRPEDSTAALLAASRGGEPRAAELARELLPDRYPYVAEFRRSLVLDPHNAELRRDLAYLLLRMGHQPAAEQEFRVIADTVPDDLLSATQLAFLLYGRGDTTSARPLFDRVLAGKDEELANRVRAVLHQPQVLQSRVAQQQTAVSAKVMAERSTKAGYLKDALRYLQTAAEANPSDSEVMLRLAWTYNNLHQDVAAIHWFDLVRKSSDPAVASEAQKAWRNLRGPTARFRTTGWIFPLFSTRWHDVFGYGQVKTELRTGIGIRPYLSARIVGDTRQTENVAVGTQYLSESSLILGVGLATTPWHGVTAWAEAGRSMNYLSHEKLHDYRGGVALAHGTGHTLRGESAGWFASTSTDAVFLSRFGNDVLVYNQERAGYTAGPATFRTQIAAIVGVTFDQQRQYWANYGEGGIGLRVSGSFLPTSMYFSFDAVRGVYLVNVGNPRAPNYYDFRAGIWYAFTR